MLTGNVLWAFHFVLIFLGFFITAGLLWLLWRIREFIGFKRVYKGTLVPLALTGGLLMVKSIVGFLRETRSWLVVYDRFWLPLLISLALSVGVFSAIYRLRQIEDAKRN